MSGRVRPHHHRAVGVPLHAGGRAGVDDVTGDAVPQGVSGALLRRAV